MKPALLVLAAGMGSRYGGLKQIDPIGNHGETIIDYSVYDAIKSGFDKIVFVIRKDIEADFRQYIGKKFEDKINVQYVFQELSNIPNGFKVPEERKKPWGTGHAILTAKSSIETPFGVINGDDFYGNDSFKKLSNYLSHVDKASNNYAMVAFMLRNTLSSFGTVSRGICDVNEEGYLTSVIEHTKIEKFGEKAISHLEEGIKLELTGGEPVSMNMFGFTPAIFDKLEKMFIDFLKERGNDIKSEYFIPTVVNNLIQKNEVKVKVLTTDSLWFGITYKEDKEYVKNSIKALIDNSVYPEMLWN